MTDGEYVFLGAAMVVCIISVVANASLLATTIKLYSEILKIGHIKNIGK